MSLGECVGAGVLDLADAELVLQEAADVVGRESSRDIARGLAQGAADPLVPDPVIFGPNTSPPGGEEVWWCSV